jgi:hypothetical protein
LCVACDPIVGGVGLNCEAAGQSQVASCEKGYVHGDETAPTPDTCTAAPCPTGTEATGTVPGTTGTEATSACTTSAGYFGKVTAVVSATGFESDVTPCTPITGGVTLTCESDSDQQVVSCAAGYVFTDNGAPTADACVPAVCPEGTTGTDAVTGCTVDAVGYFGAFTADTSAAGYTSTVGACNDFASDPSTVDGSCTTCTGDLATDCTVATCATGFHTYTAADGKCKPCVFTYAGGQFPDFLDLDTLGVLHCNQEAACTPAAIEVAAADVAAVVAAGGEDEYHFTAECSGKTAEGAKCSITPAVNAESGRVEHFGGSVTCTRGAYQVIPGTTYCDFEKVGTALTEFAVGAGALGGDLTKLRATASAPALEACMAITYSAQCGDEAPGYAFMDASEEVGTCPGVDGDSTKKDCEDGVGTCAGGGGETTRATCEDSSGYCEDAGGVIGTCAQTAAHSVDCGLGTCTTGNEDTDTKAECDTEGGAFTPTSTAATAGCKANDAGDGFEDACEALTGKTACEDVNSDNDAGTKDCAFTPGGFTAGTCVNDAQKYTTTAVFTSTATFTRLGFSKACETTAGQCQTTDNQEDTTLGSCAQTAEVTCSIATTAGCRSDGGAGFEDACRPLTDKAACTAVNSDTNAATKDCTFTPGSFTSTSCAATAGTCTAGKATGDVISSGDTMLECQAKIGKCSKGGGADAGYPAGANVVAASFAIAAEPTQAECEDIEGTCSNGAHTTRSTCEDSLGNCVNEAGAASGSDVTKTMCSDAGGTCDSGNVDHNTKAKCDTAEGAFTTTNTFTTKAVFTSSHVFTVRGLPGAATPP